MRGRILIAALTAACLTACPCPVGAADEATTQASTLPADDAQGREIARLIADFREDDWTGYGDSAGASEAASDAFVKMGERALPALIEALDDPDAAVRFGAVETLHGLYASAEPAVPALTAALSDPSARVRGAAAEALEAIGPSSIEAVVQLSLCLADPRKRIRSTARRALLDDAVPAESTEELLRRLSFPDATVRRTASEALGYVATDTEETVAGLIACLEDPDAGVRRAAVRAIGDIRYEWGLRLPSMPGFGSQTPQFLEIWRDADVQRRSPPPRALEPLVKSLRDTSPDVRKAAALVVGAYGLEARQAVGDLVRILVTHTSARARASAACSLGRIAQKPRLVTSALEYATRDKCDLVRYHALRALTAFGPEAVPAAPTVAELTQSNDPVLRRTAVLCLGAMGPPAGAYADRIAAQAASAAASGEGVLALRAILGADGAREALRRRFRELPPSRARSTFRVIGRIGDAAYLMVPGIAEQLDSPSNEARAEAAFALGRLGGCAVGALARLRQVARKDPDSSCRYMAEQAVERIESDLTWSYEPLLPTPWRMLPSDMLTSISALPGLPRPLLFLNARP